MRLDSIAKAIRSKNAGPCLLTLDLMLPDEATFAYVASRIGPCAGRWRNATDAAKTKSPSCRSRRRSR